jgi:hypothetical protein
MKSNEVKKRTKTRGKRKGKQRVIKIKLKREKIIKTVSQKRKGVKKHYLDPMVKLSYISKTDGQMFYIF